MQVNKPINRRFLIDGIYTSYRFLWDESFVFTGESHDFWEIIFVKSGKVEITEDENIYTLGEGNAILHAPMEFHRIKSAGGTHPTVLVLTFSHIGEIPSGLREGVFTLDAPLAAEFEALNGAAMKFIKEAEKAVAKAHPSDGGEAKPPSTENAIFGQELADRLSLFLIKLSSRVSARGGASMTQSAVEYRKIISFMTEHVSENLSLTELAEENNISVSYVKLLFSTYAGISPKSYFNQLRLRHATELLKSGKTVAEVSDLMGFSSPSYLSAFVKRLSGAPPTVHQKNAEE